MSRLSGPRGIRTRLLLVTLLAVFSTLAATVIAFNVILANRLDAQATDVARNRAESRIAALAVVGGHIVSAETPDSAVGDTPVWVFEGSRTLEAPATTERLAAAAVAAGATQVAHVVASSGAGNRLYAAPVVAGGRRVGSVVAAVSLAPYDQTRRDALIASLLLTGAMLTTALIATRWVLSRALEPVARMTGDAAAWSEHDLHRRFALGPPHDELTQLAATLDGLLERIASGRLREQRFTAELSHELRTPLARARSEAELALRRPRNADEYRAALASVLQNVVSVAGITDTLLAAARHEATGATRSFDARQALRHVAASNLPLAAERGMRISVADGPPLHVACDDDLLERILDPLVANGCRYGAGTIRLDAGYGGNGAWISVSDEGPGLVPDEREAIFEPGRRGVAAPASGDGSGLGLALARRLARAAGGDITADGPTEGRGARFRVFLPVPTTTRDTSPAPTS